MTLSCDELVMRHEAFWARLIRALPAMLLFALGASGAGLGEPIRAVTRSSVGIPGSPRWGHHFWLERGDILALGESSKAKPAYYWINPRVSAVAQVTPQDNAIAVLQSAGYRGWRSNGSGDILLAWKGFRPGPAYLVTPSGKIVTTLLDDETRVLDACWHSGLKRFVLLSYKDGQSSLLLVDAEGRKREGPNEVSQAIKRIAPWRGRDLLLAYQPRTGSEVSIQVVTIGENVEIVPRRRGSAIAVIQPPALNAMWFIEAAPLAERILMAGVEWVRPTWIEQLSTRYTKKKLLRGWREFAYLIEKGEPVARPVVGLGAGPLRARLRFTPDGQSVSYLQGGVLKTCGLVRS